MSHLPPPPALLPMTHIDCEVKALVTLGPGPYGERRYVPLGGGTVRGPELNGTLVEGPSITQDVQRCFWKVLFAVSNQLHQSIFK